MLHTMISSGSCQEIHTQDGSVKSHYARSSVSESVLYHDHDSLNFLDLDIDANFHSDVPHLRRSSYYTGRGFGSRTWRNGSGMVVPPPMVVPFFHSPNMVANVKHGYGPNRQNWKEGWESKEVVSSVYSTPVQRKQKTLAWGAVGVDDTSDDSDSSKSARFSHDGHERTGSKGSYQRLPHHCHHFPSLYNHHSGRKRQQTGSGDRNGRDERNSPQPELRPEYHIPPDRFLERAHLVQVTRVPSQLQTGGEWGVLSQQMYNRFMASQQTSETFRRKVTLWRNLFLLIRSHFPKYGLFLVGSTMNGFGTNDSDVDMCLLVRNSGDFRVEALSHLSQLSYYLKRCSFIDRVQLIQAKVPILKFRGVDFSVDLNCNNAVGIRNTHLLHCYAQLDWRVRPLVVLVKLWAAKNDINDAKRMTISSYSLSLMVIHFLQCGVTPAVLPCLHDMYKDKFTQRSDISSIDLHEQLAPFKSTNKQPLGQLLVDFLHYYSTFDYSKHAMSVRLANTVSIEDCRRFRTYKNDPHQWKCLCIEEPFDHTNTARSVYDASTFERIKRVFTTSHSRLNESRSLRSILG